MRSELEARWGTEDWLLLNIDRSSRARDKLRNPEMLKWAVEGMSIADDYDAPELRAGVGASIRSGLRNLCAKVFLYNHDHVEFDAIPHEKFGDHPYYTTIVFRNERDEVHFNLIYGEVIG